MIANWKALVLFSIGVVAIAWLGPRVGTIAANESRCISEYSTPCAVEIKYAYPAHDLSVVPDDGYF